MSTTLVNFRLDDDVKVEMEKVCAEIGISMTTAFTVYARSIARNKRIPFDLTALPIHEPPAHLVVDTGDPASIENAIAPALDDVKKSRVIDIDTLDAYLHSKGIMV